MSKLLLGVEAVGQGAIDAGLSGVYAYPGTPSTEITEYIQNSREAQGRGVHSDWSSNEKTAMEAALGMSYAGKRAMVCMKHVGLNVAADPFVNSAITGANGGLVVAVADDPSMHSSQNEQDSRFYGKFAMVPVLEPSNQQEAYEMVGYGFEISEKFGTPVLLRLTTRLAHSRAGVETHKPIEENAVRLPGDPRQFILLPAIARGRYKALLGNQANFEESAENSRYNFMKAGSDHSMGIITSGIAYNYLKENYQSEACPYPVLKIGQYPLPYRQVEELTNKVEKLLIIEEGYPYIEEMLRGFLNRDLNVLGRLDGTLPRDGELNPGIVAKALGLVDEIKRREVPGIVRNRPPELCPGCSHRDTYAELNEAMREYGGGRVFSDIGCYTLGALEPFNAISSCVDMGASITMAKGAADAGLRPSVAVIGDSTFTHSGITGLLDAVQENTPVTIIISDNSTTAMTGGQDTPAEGRIEKICEGIGVDTEHIHVLEPKPKFFEHNVDILKKEIAYEGVSVVIPRRECIVNLAKKAKRRRNKKKEAQAAKK